MAWDLDDYIERCYRREILPEATVREICAKLKEVLVTECNVRHIQTPCTVVGDLHGQFYDVLEIFKIGGYAPNTNYVFLGDYVDRGYYSVETITLLACLKLRWPDRITLVRGNHESRAVTQTYGFYTECQRKYGSTKVWQHFTDMFDYMGLAVIIDGAILCLHGGLSPSIHTLDQIRVLNRFREIPHEGAMADLVWSDPSLPSRSPWATGDGKLSGRMDGLPQNASLAEATMGSAAKGPPMPLADFAVSPRGAGYLFGPVVTQHFLHTNGLGHLCRAHQLCMEGYQLLFDDQVSTVWSAPNYCYRAGNLASVLEISPGLERLFNVFSACPDALRDVALPGSMSPLSQTQPMSDGSSVDMGSGPLVSSSSSSLPSSSPGAMSSGGPSHDRGAAARRRHALLLKRQRATMPVTDHSDGEPLGGMRGDPMPRRHDSGIGHSANNSAMMHFT